MEKHSSCSTDRKSTRLNSSHTEIYTLSLHDALPISYEYQPVFDETIRVAKQHGVLKDYEVLDGKTLILLDRSEEHTSELQSHRDLHSFPTRRSSDLL